MLKCSRPDPISLLEALQPVFNLSSIRPVMNMSNPTKVSIGFVMFGILGVDEKAQILKTFIWQNLRWRNEFVRWDPEQCGSSWITIPRKLLWVPDVVINELNMRSKSLTIPAIRYPGHLPGRTFRLSVMEKNSAPFVPYNYLYSDGLVVDEQPVKVVSSCRLDIYTFPFDIQNCSLSFNSYLHTIKALPINRSLSAEEIFKLSKEVMTTMGEWELIGITAKTFLQPAGEHEKYQELRFFVSVRRRATLYVVNLLLPSCFLITVDLFSFLLPPKSVDRSLFKMTLILGYTVFLLIMNDLLPITGNTIPLINVFLSLCLALMVASLLETIIITNLLCGSAHFSPMPRWVKVIFLHFLGSLVCLPPKPSALEDTVFQNPDVQEMTVSSLVEDGNAPEQVGPPVDDKTVQELRSLGEDLQAIHLQVKQQLDGSQSSDDWIQMGFIIDRLLFGLYILFITVSFITIIIIWAQSYNIS